MFDVFNIWNVFRPFQSPPMGGDPLAALIASLFGNDEAGGLWLPGPDTCWADIKRTTPATVGSTVAFMDDPKDGPRLGPELVTNGAFDTDASGWTAGSGVDLSVVDGNLRITRGGSVNQSNTTTVDTTIGKFYELRFTYRGRSAGSTHYTDMRIGEAAGGLQNARLTDTSPLEFSAGEKSAVFVATVASTFISVLLRDGVSNDWIEIDNISVRELPGAHATQASIDARPQLQEESGKFYLLDDLIDDALIATFPASLGSDCTISYADAAGVTTLTGQTVGTTFDLLRSQRIYGLALIDRALTAGETTLLQNYLGGRRP